VPRSGLPWRPSTSSTARTPQASSPLQLPSHQVLLRRMSGVPGVLRGRTRAECPSLYCVSLVVLRDVTCGAGAGSSLPLLVLLECCWFGCHELMSL
jgi:hypothetical protein